MFINGVQFYFYHGQRRECFFTQKLFDLYTEQSFSGSCNIYIELSVYFTCFNLSFHEKQRSSQRKCREHLPSHHDNAIHQGISISQPCYEEKCMKCLPILFWYNLIGGPCWDMEGPLVSYKNFELRISMYEYSHGLSHHMTGNPESNKITTYCWIIHVIYPKDMYRSHSWRPRLARVKSALESSPENEYTY